MHGNLIAARRPSLQTEDKSFETFMYGIRTLCILLYLRCTCGIAKWFNSGCPEHGVNS